MVALRDRILRRGYECPVINLTRHRGRTGDSVYFPDTAAGVLRLIRGLKPQIIHVHVGGDLTLRLAALGAVSKYISPARVIMTFHSGGFPSSPQGRAMDASDMKARLLRRHDHLIAVNAEIGRFFERCGIAKQKISVISPYAPVKTSDAVMPPAFADFAKKHKPLLVTVGLLEPEYDLPMQIETLGEIRKLHPAAGLIIIGSGSLESELRARIEAHPWRADILLSGDIGHPETLKTIEQSDLMLRTTLYDGDALSVREAVELGVPVVATSTIFRPRGVHLVPIQDREALLVKALEVLALPRVPAPAIQSSIDNLDAVLRLYESLSG